MKKISSPQKAIIIIAAMVLLVAVVSGVVLSTIFRNDDPVNTGVQLPIVGKFTEEKITDGESAILAVQSVASDLGLDNATDELTVKKEDTVGNLTYYRLQQNYQGIPVYGSDFVVIADKNGEAKGVTGNTKEIDSSISLIPTVTQEQVNASIQYYFGEGTEVSIPTLSDDTLVVYNFTDTTTLSYEMKAYANGVPHKVIVDATNATVISAFSLVYYDDKEDVPKTYEKDDVRKLIVYDAEKKDWKDWSVNGEIFPEAHITNQKAAALMENTQITYGFFKKFLELESFSGENGALAILVDCSFSETTPNNAMADTDHATKSQAMICFGYENEGNLDTVAHEYTHLVEYFISHMDYQGLSGAIMEGYSDIFGELVEDWSNDWQLNNNCNWIHEGRNMISPKSNWKCIYVLSGDTCPHYQKDKTHYWYEEGNYKFIEGKTCAVGYPSSINDQGFVIPSVMNAETDYGNVHTNNTVISHAAYLMTQSKTGGTALTTEELAHLWYNTLYTLPSNCTFNALRRNMLMVADSLEYTAKQIDCIAAAFDAVGIDGMDGGATAVEEYGTNPELLVYGADMEFYDDYTIDIIKAGNDKSENKHIVVTDTDPVSLKMSTGNYTVTIRDRKDSSKIVTKNIRIVNDRDADRTIQFATNFGSLTSVSISASSTETTDVTTDTITDTSSAGTTSTDTSTDTESNTNSSGVGEEVPIIPETQGVVIKDNLQGIVMADNTVKITNYTGSATTLEIPKTINGHAVTSIGNSAFKNCTSLTSVNIPDSVTSIDGFAFDGCSSLTSVNIPKGVTSINNATFCNCTALASVTIPDSVASIGPSAFLNCTSLTSVTIPNSVASIGNSAFSSCTSLTSVTIPNNVTSIGEYAFSDCSSLTSVNISKGVTSIGDSAFRDCTSLTSVSIPDSVTSIGDGAFFGCTSLPSVTMPNSVTSIGIAVFRKCTSLTSVNISNGITSIGNYTFESCSSLTSVTIPNGVTSIDLCAFLNCTSLTSVTIPGSVTSIDLYAFRDCTSLISVTIPGSVTSIGEGAFYECESLTSVNISKGVTSIGNYTFESCSSLTSVTIPNGVTSIGGSAFSGCSSLTSVTIPDSVTSIGGYVFDGCTSLTSVNISKGVTSIADDMFRDCTSLTSVTIPDRVTSIGAGAFFGCTSLTSVTIPNSVTSINNAAFRGCTSLTSVNIPKGVTSIGDFAFNGCKSLKNVYYNGTKAQWNKISIGLNNNPLTSATIHFQSSGA